MLVLFVVMIEILISIKNIFIKFFGFFGFFVCLGLGLLSAYQAHSPSNFFMKLSIISYDSVVKSILLLYIFSTMFFNLLRILGLEN